MNKNSDDEQEDDEQEDGGPEWLYWSEDEDGNRVFDLGSALGDVSFSFEYADDFTNDFADITVEDFLRAHAKKTGIPLGVLRAGAFMGKMMEKGRWN